MMMSNTFEQLFKTKLANDLDNFITDRELVFVNDFGLISGCTGTQIYATVVTGAGTRVVSTNADNIEQTFSIFFYVPINFAQNLLEVLYDYGSTESAMGNVQSLPPFSFYTLWQTPTTDGVPFKLGAYNYLLVSLTGNLLYSTTTITLGNTSVTLNSIPLRNIITYAFNSQALTESLPVVGISRNALITTGLLETVAITILLDTNDTLHNFLLSYARNPNINNSNVTIGLPNGVSFSGAMTVSTQESPNAFSYLKIDITRNDLFGEV
jgi:hypothetical protein